MYKKLAYSIAALATAALFANIAHAAPESRLDTIKARGTLVCATQNASAPYGYQDPKTRQYVGYDVDICGAIAKQLGVKLDHKPVSTDARIPEVKTGHVDIVAGSVAWLPARAEQVAFSDQYLEGHIKVLVKKDAGINSLADLAGKKVCASSGSSSAAVAQKVIQGADIITYQNISQCYMGLQSGKVAGMTAGELVLIRFLNDSQSTDSPTKLLPESTYTEHIGIIMKKDEPHLMDAVNKALVAIDQDGELTKIFDKWMGEQSIYKLQRNFKVEPMEQAVAGQ